MFDDKDINKLIELYKTHKDIIRYLCGGIEICPTTKKRHLQGWIQFYNKKRFGGVKKMLGNAHIEACLGNEYDNDKYCTKEGNFFKVGKFITQGHRTDLEMIQKRILDGANKFEIMMDNFMTYCRYRNGITDFMNEVDRLKRKQFRHVNVEVYEGTTGLGKTRYAMAHKDVYKIEGDSLNWFDGYNGEKTLVIDEYSNDIKITKLLNFLDGYQLRLPIKGGFTYANWNKVIITTNLTKEEFHISARLRHREALFRRISKWYNFNLGEFPTFCAEMVQG